MTILRQSAMRELNAFKRLEHLRKKADINENDELKRYREEKYGR